MPESIYETAGWKRKYMDLMAQLGVQLPDPVERKRGHPRFQPPHAGKEPVIRAGDAACELINISVGGICLLSETPLEVGAKVPLSIADVFVPAQVVDCLKGKPGEESEREVYRVGARFASEEQGYKCFVLVVKNFTDTALV